MTSKGGLTLRLLRTGLWTLFAIALMALALSGCEPYCADCAEAEPACNHDGRCDTDESAVGCPDDCTADDCNQDGHCDPNENETGCPEDCD